MAAKGFGIIGLGMISEFHASAIEHMDNARLVAGFDPVPGLSSKNWGSQFHISINQSID